MAGLLSPSGPNARVVDLLLDGTLQVAYDDPILIEYRRVLNYEQFHLDPQEIDTLLGFIEREGERVSAHPIALEVRHSGDRRFLEVALEFGAEVLITWNKDDYPRPEALAAWVKQNKPSRPPLVLLTATEFLARWRERGGSP